MAIIVNANTAPIQGSPLLTDYFLMERDGGSGKWPQRTLVSVILSLLQSQGLYVENCQDGITAAGTTQGTATALTATINRVDTVAAGTGVVSRGAAIKEFTEMVINNGANDLKYYPLGSAHFYIVGTGAMANSLPITIYAGTSVKVKCFTNGELTVFP